MPTVNVESLLPCPFCGGSAYPRCDAINSPNWHPDTYKTECNWFVECGPKLNEAHLCANGPLVKGMDAAIAAWNSRVDTTESDAVALWHAERGMRIELETQIATLTATNKRLSEALEKYGRHAGDCPARWCKSCGGDPDYGLHTRHRAFEGGHPHVGTSGCNCGLTATRLSGEDQR